MSFFYSKFDESRYVAGNLLGHPKVMPWGDFLHPAISVVVVLNDIAARCFIRVPTHARVWSAKDVVHAGSVHQYICWLTQHGLPNPACMTIIFLSSLYIEA